ncbi:vitamin B12-dependent ribonucleotide reductase [Saccharopolyspora hattusasensis]|uniref:TSCPD domain-containing protein n=1 Tax=Saccharopolyspora hattusasensis TaxID=1128679 RepID=UPI003D996C11
MSGSVGIAEVTVTPTITRRRLPRVRSGQRISASVGGVDLEVIMDLDNDGQLCDIHLPESGPHGSFQHGMLSAYVSMMSLALRYGAPLEEIVDRFVHTRFEPSGYTDAPDIPRAASVVDYLARRIALDFLPRTRQEILGIAPGTRAVA